MRNLSDLSDDEVEEFLGRMTEALAFAAARARVVVPRYVLLMFSDPHNLHFASDCERDALVKVFREAADKLEKREDVPQ